MTIPDFQSIMLPLLQFAGDKQEHSLRESIEYLADFFKLTDEEQKELLPSGQQAIFDNRVGWAKTHLKKAQLLESTRRGEAIGKVKDGGMDGIIKEDRLGLDIIYIQAKRWEGTVGRPEIQKFAGALLGQQARKGIFITTSQFSKEAIDYASVIDSKIILIDGNLLSKLLIDYNGGVSPVKIYEIKKIDTDYFTE